MTSLTTNTLDVANDLRQFREDSAAEWVENCSDDEFVRVSNAAMFVWDYGPTTAAGNSMSLSKASAIGAVYVHEGAPRKLARGRRDLMRPLPKTPKWRRRSTNTGLQRFFDEFYGVGDDFVDFWAETPAQAHERIARERASRRSRPKGTVPSEPTHVLESGSDRYRHELNDWARPIADQWAWSLGRMDGGENAIFATWALPPGKRLGFFDPDSYDTGYLQSAGSSDRLAVEVRYLDADKSARQYAVARAGTGHANSPMVSIAYGSDSVEVYPTEVFTANEAVAVYEAYRLTGRVPEEYPLRPLDL
jgi:hypothetical protein